MAYLILYMLVKLGWAQGNSCGVVCWRTKSSPELYPIRIVGKMVYPPTLLICL